MKKVLVSAAAIAVLVGVSSFVGPAWGQSKKKTPAEPHKVGLIDMAHVFKNYKKFEALREDLKIDIQRSDEQAKQSAEEIKAKQAQMKEFKEGTPDYVQMETELLQLTSKFEAFRKSQQREFLRKESKIYKTIYLEVTDMVEKAAVAFGYTLVIRFNRQDLDSSKNPQEVMQRMNRQVVYHRTDDDLTDPVLKELNRAYERTSSTSSSGKNSAQRR